MCASSCFTLLFLPSGYVIISMDALDQLLVSCHANSLNLFVESFLQMVQKLLESTEPTLQLRATQSVCHLHLTSLLSFWNSFFFSLLQLVLVCPLQAERHSF